MGGTKRKAKAVAAAAPIKEDCSRYEFISEKIIANLAAAVKAGEVLEMMRLTYFVDGLEHFGYPKLHELIHSNPVYQTNYNKTAKPYEAWRSRVAVGDYVDILSEKEFTWFESKVLEIDHKTKAVKVHYTGWDAKYDEVLNLEEKVVVPHNTFTAAKKKAVRVFEEDDRAEEPVQQKKSAKAPESATAAVLSAAVDDLGRGSRRRACATTTTATSSSISAVEQNGEDKLKDDKPKEEKDLNDWICGICGWLEAADGSDLVLCEAFCRRSFHLGCMKGKMVVPKADETHWFCSDCRAGQHECFVCKKRGADNVDVHKCNQLPCGKYYHLACLAGGANEFIVPTVAILQKKEVSVVMPIAATIPAACSGPQFPNGATAGKTVAGRPKAGSTTGPAAVTSPSASAAALDNTPRSTRGIKLDFRALNNAGSSPAAGTSVRVVDPAVAEAAALQAAQEAEYAQLERETGHLSYEIKKVLQENVPSFKCPQHFCYNCFDFYGSVATSDINKCMSCARAYHVNCIPPGSRFNSVCLMCPRHPDDPLPSHEMRMDPKTKRPKATSNLFTQFWEQLAIPDVFPNPNDPFDNHFKLQQHIRDDVAGAAAPFTAISKNDYSFMAGRNTVPKFVPEVRCECKIDCDENCLNRILRIECCDTKIKTAGESGDMVICNVGAGCTNRALQKHKCPKTEPFREFKMGYGLRAKEHIYEGMLVMEYVGEVIDHAEVQRRMTSQRELTPMDKDFYIMELDNGVFVDGKFRGSTSRFINHSCDPNCELQRWVVKGMPRIGIFAIRDIAPGEALSYDYQFDTKEEEAFKCYCGTEKCRGTMAPKKKKAILYDANGRPQSREERMRLMQMGKNKEQSMSRETLIEAEWARSYTGKCVPGDPINEIKNGPVKATLAPGRDAHVFLCRTIKRSSNFFERNELQLKRQRAHELATRLTSRNGHSTGNGTTRSSRSSGHASSEGEDATAPGLMLEDEN